MWRYQKATIMETTVFTPAQQRILQMMSYVKSDEEFADIEDLLSNYFAKKVDDELDVYVGNIRKFTALPGSAGDDYAVRITSVIREEQ